MNLIGGEEYSNPVNMSFETRGSALRSPCEKPLDESVLRTALDDVGPVGCLSTYADEDGPFGKRGIDGSTVEGRNLDPGKESHDRLPRPTYWPVSGFHVHRCSIEMPS
jgi:hypothetical protein